MKFCSLRFSHPAPPDANNADADAICDVIVSVNVFCSVSCSGVHSFESRFPAAYASCRPNAGGICNVTQDVACLMRDISVYHSHARFDDFLATRKVWDQQHEDSLGTRTPHGASPKHVCCNVRSQ